MKHADRARWKQAATAAYLGELVIAWLNGEIRETPAHLGPPAAETIPLIPVLTLVNRAGLVTDSSQLAGHRVDDAWNAWVCGFASDAVLGRLRDAVAGTPLALTACRRCEHECWQRAGEWWHCPWKDIADFWAERCPRAADELYGSWYVCISDPEPGRNDVLWPALERLAR